MVRALREAAPDEEVLWYRDAPYAIRGPDARPSPLLPTGLEEFGVDVAPYLEARLDAAASGTQLGFQFEGEAAMRGPLARFARREAARLGRGGPPRRFWAGRRWRCAVWRGAWRVSRTAEAG